MMRFIFLIFTLPLFAETTFLIKENKQWILHEGNSDQRYSPCSTFKIAISLMGYQEEILIDEKNPCISSIDPLLWLAKSQVWYSQVITQKLGMKKFQSYVKQFGYGNCDVSGGLMKCWLANSLQISPDEQIQFLEKLLAYQLPVSRRAHDMTRKILFVETLDNGWRLYGKTGNTPLSQNTGWFVGWAEKGSRVLIFSYLLKDNEDTYASLRAKKAVKNHLRQIAPQSPD